MPKTWQNVTDLHPQKSGGEYKIVAGPKPVDIPLPRFAMKVSALYTTRRSSAAAAGTELKNVLWEAASLLWHSPGRSLPIDTLYWHMSDGAANWLRKSLAQLCDILSCYQEDFLLGQEIDGTDFVTYLHPVVKTDYVPSNTPAGDDITFIMM
eukprot:TRINITY_DN50762_c0_g1_i2.p1 TRINITY_DN50762_c0_g1~~TRINITY_DN50762_c0_g1_i2.p1  ORF type:complete len:152 (-),score=29.16 TRINITY_DN50762_c0_g1_i2:232-687(-)